MAYTDLLNQKEWTQKRTAILSRDRYTCQDCGQIGFHNGYESFIEAASIDEINNLLDGWHFNGMTFSDYCSNIDSYEYESPQASIYEKEELCSQEHLYNLKIQIYGNNTKHFRIRQSERCKLSVLSEFDYDKLEVKTHVLFNKIDNTGHDSVDSYIICMIFDKSFTNKFLFKFKGKNAYYDDSSIIYGDYELLVIFENKVIRLFITSTKEELFKGLNIHHKYYVLGRKPWDYEDEALITLCEKCHQKRHENKQVPIYNDNKEIIDYANICDRCHGSGYIPEYYHVQQGICFKCGGEGVII